MRTQIRALNEATEMKTGGNGNGHAAHIHNIDRLAGFVGRLGQKTGRIGVALPKNTRRSESKIFVRSPWIATGTLIVNMPGNRLAETPSAFVKSPWITTGNLTVITVKNEPSAFSKFFLRSKWIISGIIKVTISVNKPSAVPGLPPRKAGFNVSNTFFLRSPWIISYGIFPAKKMRHSIENSLRLVAALVWVKQDRKLLSYLKAA